MFTYLKVNNYKSLVNLKWDLMKNKSVKKLAILYGENGSGKSNISTAFFTLAEFLRTMEIRDVIKKYLERNESTEDDLEDKEEQAEFIEFLKQNFKNTETIIKSCKTINSKGNMLLEFGFLIDGSKGNYIIETDDFQIVREELNYRVEKNKGCLFSIEKNNIKLNDKMFNNRKYYEEILIDIEKFWGKHSLMAILSNEVEDKTEKYMNKQINRNLKIVLDFFNGFCCKVKIGNRSERGRIGISHKILANLDKGEIARAKEKELDNIEEVLNEFFTRLYSDVKEVYYDKEYNEDNIKYKLFFKKMIYNEIKDINFTVESTGTQWLLDLFPLILAAIEGNVVIIDEFDTGIHDLLVAKLIECLNNYIKGQLIITTHNTMIMESDIDKKSLYVIVSDLNDNKKIECIADIDKVHPNKNIRDRYLNGLYRGIPSMMDIDFDELLDILNR